MDQDLQLPASGKILSEAVDWRYALLAATAVTLCYWLTRVLGFGAGYWAAITSVVVCQSQLGTTILVSRDRMVGTVIGGVSGWITATFWHDRLILFAVSLALTLALCNWVSNLSAGRLAGVTQCIVVLVPHPNTGILHTATSRFLEVAFGICVTVAMTLLFYPKSTLEALKLSLTQRTSDTAIIPPERSIGSI